MKLTKTSVIACLVAVSTISSVSVPAFAVINSHSTNIVENQKDSNLQNSKFIIDENEKTYFDFKKGIKVAGFNFKVPDYCPAGYSAIKNLYVTHLNENQNYIEIDFEKSSGASTYSFYASPVSITEVLKADSKLFKDDRFKIQSTEKNIGNLKGEDITLIGTSLENNSNVKTINKYFAWEDNGIYYAIQYYNFSQDDIDTNGTVSVEINDEDIEKIINSLQKPEQTKNIKYFEKDKHEDPYLYVDRYIYDNDDLNEAEKTLGFKPNLVKNTLLKPEGASVLFKYRDYDEKEKAHLMFEVDYKLNGNFAFRLDESSNNTVYNEIKDKKYYFTSGKEKKDELNITTDKLNINNIDVYRAKSKDDYHDITSYTYAFKYNDVYYEVYKDEKGESKDTATSLEKAIQIILSQK